MFENCSFKDFQIHLYWFYQLEALIPDSSTLILKFDLVTSKFIYLYFEIVAKYKPTMNRSLTLIIPLVSAQNSLFSSAMISNKRHS